MRLFDYFFIAVVCFSISHALKRIPYNEDLAVNLTILSGSVYCNIESIVKNFDQKDPNIEIRTVGKNLDRMKYVYYDHIHKYLDVFKNELKMVAYVNHEKKHFVLAFEGTHGKLQLLEILLRSENFPYDLHHIPDASVLEYFQDSYESTFRTKFLTILRNIKKIYPSYQIIYTGHSMGGALALLAALDGTLLKITDPNVLVYTFGQPRTGNFEFREFVDKTLPNVYRIVHNNDMIPHMPTCNFVFGCQQVYGLEEFYHTNTEIWYPNQGMPRGDYEECYDEDPYCANSISVVQASQKDHLYYFGIRISCQQHSVFEDANSEEELMMFGYELFTKEQLLSH